MLITLLLTRDMMPVLYTYFPAPIGRWELSTELVVGSHYSDRFFPSLEHLEE
jgi:heavy metal efflux system protein